VYNRSRSPRVIAREHTGLLERKVRELLETDFKNRTKFNAPNTLVATSTLEMGIDIGSLQIAINTSVPPTPASFLQRVGRAGRKTGTALVVNFATRRSHDQYYFAEPAEMMAGEVTAPGCYLEAREILRRHYFAFCIDSWTGANPQDHHIPSMVRHLKLMQTDVLGPSFFMNRILSFVAENEDSLLSRFLEAYRGKVSENTLLVLTEWVKSPQFVPFHQQVFARLKSELESLQKLKAAIARRIQEERLQPGDDLYDELLREQRSVGGIFSNIEKRMVLEHLTNVGVLPNYAFPETGVTLNARVFKQTGMQAVRSPLNKEYVIVRPASQALRELVPGSAFYSQGYRFEIGGLSLHDLAGEGEHYMRFCSACDYIAESSTSIEHVPCPKCGDESWMANSNRHRVAHLASVRSSTSSSKSRVVDHHETRQSDPFHISRHFKFNRSAGAYAIQAANFGIEFVRETQVTEFNLGLEGRGTHANVMEINGAKYPRHGFITCKTCGKSTPRPLKDAPKYHYGYCPHADVAWTDASTHHFHELYLFRQMSTEALKVLVPVQDVDTSGAGLELFQAGLELGFRKYFKGNPQHLLLRPYQEFNRSSGRKDLYIIILDAVPGGTGYLEKLFTPEQFGEVLRLAHDAMAECTCQLAGKDGCYRCVFSYRNQRAHEELSRKAGVEMFKGIVDRLDGWERMVDGLDAIAQTGRLEESELERKFINVLRKHARSQPDWTWNEENVDGQVHFP
jgi:DEAD/DEAH box helicase domain-containing protein